MRGPYLPLHALHLHVLRVDLVAHVQGHALQVPQDAAHVGQVVVHLVLAGVVGHPGGRAAQSASETMSRVCSAACLCSEGKQTRRHQTRLASGEEQELNPVSSRPFCLSQQLCTKQTSFIGLGGHFSSERV